MSPYAATGTFTSRVLDSGGAGSDWTALAPETSMPAETQASVETRSGDSATPDGAWSPWQPLGGLGSIVSPNARYLQYRVALTTTDATRTPAFERATVGYRPAPGP